MKNLIVALSSLSLLACGMENDPAAAQGTNTDPLYAAELGTGEQLTGGHTDHLAAREGIAWSRSTELPSLERGEFCTTEWVLPTAQGTIQSIPRLGVFGVAPVGSEIQSSYFRSNSVNEEFRRGIAEFYVTGEISGAVLQFREHRGWTSYPLPSDSHQIEVYPANLELDPEDFGERGVLVGMFDTDPNLEPIFANAYDLTKAVQQIGAKLGVRFSLEGGIGSGTSFTDMRMEVTRCRELARPGF
jgi:hypothetical protein